MFPNHMHANYLLPKGNTEREFLANFESIVRNSLPLKKLIKRHFTMILKLPSWLCCWHVAFEPVICNGTDNLQHHGFEALQTKKRIPAYTMIWLLLAEKKKASFLLWTLCNVRSGCQKNLKIYCVSS